MIKIAKIRFISALKGAIGNPVKYSEASEVEMSARIENGALVISVKDDGRGFDVDENKSGFGGNGLINMRRRAKNLGGRFEIESQENFGTSVTIKIPIR